MQAWNEFIDFSEYLKTTMSGYCGSPSVEVVDQHTNYYYASEKTDLAHISIIDMRESKKMWMMHVACYSKSEYPMPIYGFDVICGARKVTGCFHDMSPTTSGYYSKASEDFKANVAPFIPKRTRDLPPWAKEIFSDHMVVAGATDDVTEIKNLVHMGKENLHAWFKELTGNFPLQSDHARIVDYSHNRAKYCKNQLENTNSKNVMVSLGLEEDYVNQFKKRQFPY